MIKKENINEDVLCILQYSDNNKSELVVDCFPITKFFKNELEILQSICEKAEVNPLEIIEFLENPVFSQIEGEYRYCKELFLPFQGIIINIKSTINSLQHRINLIFKKAELEPEKFDVEKENTKIKKEFYEEFKVWIHAYAIHIAYRQCFNNPDILTFSHRIVGWANPAYKLSCNFSIQIKTNFGYGSSSYFYTIIKFKGIEIIPLSEWVDYERAKFSDIIKYTQQYRLTNEEWLAALEYAKDACNLSLKDENAFISNYVLDECEFMTSKLQQIFEENSMYFKNSEGSKFKFDKTGHFLLEFKAEKISGALDFIEKILEYRNLTNVDRFIHRIIAVNKKIQPYLSIEIPVIESELIKLRKIILDLTPEYNQTIEEYEHFKKIKVDIKNEIIKKNVKYINELIISRFSNRDKNLDHYDILLSNQFPEYLTFKKKYDKIVKEYQDVQYQIYSLDTVKNNILKYNEKIVNYLNESKLL